MGSFHLHLPQLHGHGHGRSEAAAVPKGCLAVVVGKGEEQRRVVVPVGYFNHPLFRQLLEVAEEEYGFEQKGPLNIPCHVQQFQHVKGVIDQENSPHHRPHHHHIGCFRA